MARKELSNIGRTGIEAEDIQPSKAWIRKHSVVRWDKRPCVPGIVMSFWIFFYNRDYCIVRIYKTKKMLAQSMGWDPLVDKSEGAFSQVDHADDPKLVGYIDLARRYCDDLLVVHEITHAVIGWMNKRAAPGRICDTDGGDGVDHELLAEEMGELVGQFWRCFSVVDRRPRPWEKL